MQYRQLGGTGTRVSTLCLGMMNFNLSNEDEGIATLHAALEAGINFVDTANVYTRGESELVTGKGLQGRRDGVVLATKVHGAMADDVNARGNGRRHVKAQCEASLRRLGTDYIDLYQLHRCDPLTPIEETLQAMDDLVREGKVHYVGISTFPAWRTMEAIAFAERYGLKSRPVTEQPPYNIFDRRIEADLVPLSAEYGLGILPWSPLASGILTGKYADGVIPKGTRLARNDTFAAHPRYGIALETSQQVVKIAEQAGLSPIQLALGWLIGQPGVTAPIIGPKNREQLDENLAAADVIVDADTRQAIDELAPPGEAIYPLG